LLVFLIIIVLFSWADASEQFAFAPVVSSSGMPRAGVARGGGFGRPQRRAGLDSGRRMDWWDRQDLLLRFSGISALNPFVFLWLLAITDRCFGWGELRLKVFSKFTISPTSWILSECNHKIHLKECCGNFNS